MCLACFFYLVSSIIFEGSLIEALAFPRHLSDTWCCSCTEYVGFHTSTAVTATIFSCACNGQLFTLSLRHVGTVSVLCQSPFHSIFKSLFQNIENSRQKGTLSTLLFILSVSPLQCRQLWGWSLELFCLKSSSFYYAKACHTIRTFAVCCQVLETLFCSNVVLAALQLTDRLLGSHNCDKSCHFAVACCVGFHPCMFLSKRQRSSSDNRFNAKLFSCSNLG